MPENSLKYGPVLIVGGEHKGRVGYLDDKDHLFSDDSLAQEFQSCSDWHQAGEELGNLLCLDMGYIYFSEFMHQVEYEWIPCEYLEPVTTDSLFRRRNELFHNYALLDYSADSVHTEVEILHEYHCVDTLLVDRMIKARFSDAGNGDVVFISHASADKRFARWLCTDLRAAGYSPWLDEWEIKVGESIPKKLSEGLDTASAMVVVLSPHAVESEWVEREWQAKYWDEVNDRRVMVLPVLYQDCDIPKLLKMKRYADFRTGYNEGLTDLLHAIASLSNETKDSFDQPPDATGNT